MATILWAVELDQVISDQNRTMSCSLCCRRGDSAGNLVVWAVLSAFSGFCCPRNCRNFFSLSSLLILLRACFSSISDYKRASSSISLARSSFTRLSRCAVSPSLAFSYSILFRMYSCTFARCDLSYSLISSLRCRLRFSSSCRARDRLRSSSSLRYLVALQSLPLLSLSPPCALLRLLRCPSRSFLARSCEWSSWRQLRFWCMAFSWRCRSISSRICWWKLYRWLLRKARKSLFSSSICSTDNRPFSMSLWSLTRFNSRSALLLFSSSSGPSTAGRDNPGSSYWLCCLRAFGFPNRSTYFQETYLIILFIKSLLIKFTYHSYFSPTSPPSAKGSAGTTSVFYSPATFPDWIAGFSSGSGSLELVLAFERGKETMGSILNCALSIRTSLSFSVCLARSRSAWWEGRLRSEFFRLCLYTLFIFSSFSLNLAFSSSMRSLSAPLRCGFSG